MIARAKSVKGSMAASKYKEREEAKAVVLVQENMHGMNYKERYDEMRTVAKMNKRTEKPFLEAVLSPPKAVGDKMTEEQWTKLAIDFAEKMEFRENQWYAVLHRNTDENHLHIKASRIDFSGKNTINDHRIGERAGRIADQLAKERGLKTAKELTAEKTQKIADVIRTQSRTATSWEQFQERMHAQGFIFQLNYNIKGLNGARVIPVSELKDNPSRREELAKKGLTLSKIDRKLKVGDLAVLFAKNQGLQKKQEQAQERTGRFKR